MKAEPLGDFIHSLGKRGELNQATEDDLGWLRISGVYENHRHWSLISKCLARISAQIPKALRIHSDWWRIETMNNDDSFQSATSSGAQASIIWCACGLTLMHSSLLERWLEQSAGEVSRPKALVAMLEHHAEAEWALSILIDRLHSLASRYHLDLFLCSIPQMVGLENGGMKAAISEGSVSISSEPGCLDSIEQFRFLTAKR